MECAFSWEETDRKTSIQNNICSIIVSNAEKSKCQKGSNMEGWGEGVWKNASGS